jgi:hypothetical protein
MLSRRRKEARDGVLQRRVLFDALVIELRSTGPPVASGFRLRKTYGGPP